jgi:hypothetical protein
VKVRVLVLDHDRTIAVDGRLDAGVADAIREARRAGVMTVLVSGRMLAEIQTALPASDLFDAIVAEGGPVLQMANRARPAVLARGPDAAFVAELRRRNVAHRSGLCMLEADAAAATDVLAGLLAVGSPYGMTFGRGTVTVLPQGVSKATGVREAVWRLGASLHNAVAIGAGEDDRPMLDVCELGVAAAWGSSALRQSAEHVVPGSGPADVAQCIRGLVGPEMIAPGSMRSLLRLRLGTGENGEPVEVENRGRNLVVAGDPRSGKTWFAGMLCEQLIMNRYAVCIVDPEGDYTCLDALPGVIVHRARPDEDLFRRLERILRQPALSVIVNLCELPTEAKRGAVRSLLRGLDALRREIGVPHRVVLDEAHYFLHSAEDVALFRPDLAGYLLVTHQISDLARPVLDACSAVILTKIADRRLAARLLGFTPPEQRPSEWLDSLAGLALGEAILLPTSPQFERGITRFTLPARSTSHVRHRQKYVDVGVPPGREFVFTRDGRPTQHRVRTLRELLHVLAQVPHDVFAGHLRRGDFHRWIEEVVGDSDLGATIRRVERSDDAAAREAIVLAIHCRYLQADSERGEGGPPGGPPSPAEA